MPHVITKSSYSGGLPQVPWHFELQACLLLRHQEVTNCQLKNANEYTKKKNEALEPTDAQLQELIPGFCNMKWLGGFVLSLDRMLVHCRTFCRNLLGFPQQFAGSHLYSWVDRGTERVQCLAQEHNTASLARARTRTARSGDDGTNHECTTPPKNIRKIIYLYCRETQKT